MNCELARADVYLREWLPGNIAKPELDLLCKIGVSTEISLRAGSEEKSWLLLATDGRLLVLDKGEPACRYSMSAPTFSALIGAKLSPQRAFFTRKLQVEGQVLLALKLGAILHEVFKRHPYSIAAAGSGRLTLPVPQIDRELTPHQRDVVTLHLDPIDGSPYWIEKARSLGLGEFTPRTFRELSLFGLMDRDALATRPFRDFLPRRILATRRPLILGESGGTSGAPVTSASTVEDFEAAFVEPMLVELARRGTGRLAQWLFVGPTGPHIIGKAATALARATTGIDPLLVDFDPRWHRKLHPGSPAAARHIEHVVSQAQRLLAKECIDSLFITPSVLRAILAKSERRWLEKLRLVHLGGQSISPEEAAWFRHELPPHCDLINGYGNSQFGCMLETDATKPLHFTGVGDRYVVEIVTDSSADARTPDGDWGRVLAHRFDESNLILNQLERDEAQKTADGLYWPRPAECTRIHVPEGIY